MRTAKPDGAAAPLPPMVTPPAPTPAAQTGRAERPAAAPGTGR
jgi:hypothetical protein